MKKEPSKLPWYKEGLNFSCTECGQCCTGSPGYVWIDADEIAAMAKTLKISEEEFVKKYTRRIGNNLSLLENNKTYDCVFLKERRCMVYKARPKQCRTFPWWPENLSSPEAWKEAAKRCEGINHKDASVVPLKVIEEQLSELGE